MIRIYCGTFTVNITGSLLLGVIVGLTAFRAPVKPWMRDGLTVGVMGGYTTFSTLMYQAVRQFEDGLPLAADADLARVREAALARLASSFSVTKNEGPNVAAASQRQRNAGRSAHDQRGCGTAAARAGSGQAAGRERAGQPE